jgi:hypothetical protein
VRGDLDRHGDESLCRNIGNDGYVEYKQLAEAAQTEVVLTNL